MMKGAFHKCKAPDCGKDAEFLYCLDRYVVLYRPALPAWRFPGRDIPAEPARYLAMHVYMACPVCAVHKADVKIERPGTVLVDANGDPCARIREEKLIPITHGVALAHEQSEPGPWCATPQAALDAMVEA